MARSSSFAYELLCLGMLSCGLLQENEPSLPDEARAEQPPAATVTSLAAGQNSFDQLRQDLDSGAIHGPAFDDEVRARLNPEVEVELQKLLAAIGALHEGAPLSSLVLPDMALVERAFADLPQLVAPPVEVQKAAGAKRIMVPFKPTCFSSCGAQIIRHAILQEAVRGRYSTMLEALLGKFFGEPRARAGAGLVDACVVGSCSIESYLREVMKTVLLLDGGWLGLAMVAIIGLGNTVAEASRDEVDNHAGCIVHQATNCSSPCGLDGQPCCTAPAIACAGSRACNAASQCQSVVPESPQPDSSLPAPPFGGGPQAPAQPAPDASDDPYRPDDDGVCPFPLQSCGGTCVDGASNPQHCGACGTTCRSGESCVNGYCGRCTVDDDCAAVTWGAANFVSEMPRRCSPSGICVGCLTDTDCLDDRLCVGTQCGFCRSDSDCPSGTPYCGPFRNLAWMNYEQANAFANSYCMSCIAGDASRNCVGTTEPYRLHCLAPEVESTGQPYFTNICTSCTSDEHCQAHIAATTGYVGIGPKCITETPTSTNGNSCGCLTNADCLAQWGGTAQCREPGSYCIGCDPLSPAGACRR